MSHIVEFFENAEIFVTGGSGVVGKALIEKLLRSCNVKRIYLLLRNKKNMNADQRLAKIREAQVFKLLRVQKPNEMDKLTAIPGDVALPNLGIDPRHIVEMSNVSIVFHCAATVRFDEPLRVALQLNVGGTLKAIQFAEQLQHLRIFVHVSTFFSNPYLTHVESKYYGSPMDWRFCLRLLDEVEDDELLDTLTRKLITGFPNTYTFTKNLAESLINDYHTRLPVIIYRPSIVLFSMSEPVPGFAPSLMGAMGLFSLVGAGLLKTVYLNKQVFLDITPQDVGIKTLMFYTVDGYEAYRKRSVNEVLVYQMSTSTHIHQTFYELATYMDIHSVWYNAAFLKNLLSPGCHYTDSRIVYMFLVFTKQVLPAFIVDTLLRLFGKPPAVMSIARRGYHTLEVMKPFLVNNYPSTGTSLINEIIEKCKGTEFDIGEEYKLANTEQLVSQCCNNMITSIRHDLLHEDPSTIRKAQYILRIKQIINKSIRFYLLYKLLSWLWCRYAAQF